MDYPIRTLGQLRPILQGFRKAAGLTQAGMASHLGVTQQTYAQLEANPAAVSVDRLFRVLQVLQVDVTLIPRAAGSAENSIADEGAPQSEPVTQTTRKTVAPRPPKKESTATARDVKRKTQSARNQETPPAVPKRVKSSKTEAAPHDSRTNAAAKPARSAAKSGRVGKKREDW